MKINNLKQDVVNSLNGSHPITAGDEWRKSNPRYWAWHTIEELQQIGIDTHNLKYKTDDHSIYIDVEDNRIIIKLFTSQTLTGGGFDSKYVFSKPEIKKTELSYLSEFLYDESRDIMIDSLNTIAATNGIRELADYGLENDNIDASVSHVVSWLAAATCCGFEGIDMMSSYMLEAVKAMREKEITGHSLAQIFEGKPETIALIYKVRDISTQCLKYNIEPIFLSCLHLLVGSLLGSYEGFLIMHGYMENAANRLYKTLPNGQDL